MKPARTKSVKTADPSRQTSRKLSAEKLYWLGPLDAEQVRVASDALDFYARILIGQFGEITDLARYGVLTDAEGKPATLAQLEVTEALLNEVKRRLTGFPSNASKGIGGQHTPAQAQHAFLLRKVIRHRLALERKPDGGPLDGVDFDDPYLVRYTPERHRVELTQASPGDSPQEPKQEQSAVCRKP